ncbi:unnamed protein product [Cuscuta epithymum]|uniref:Glucose-methanol-choline oxidoreductase N-terminal domain-containing protein n=1 Tax=Cuscuta epithymum TaxID=186058 RepID=A0AAV0GD01_9ASTE|nr:unnamed protein product [Cuscuta epithymum]CAH9145463.1 unnamed protein product [Cuscuta epithymum]
MALVGHPLLLLLISSSLLCLTHGGRENFWRDKYPFIKYAGSYSSSGASSPSASNAAVGGGSKAYDYIIVGGGTAGCPLAATLSEKFSVLLLERGGVPFGNANVSFLENFHISLADTSPSSASQVFVSTDGVYNSRARVLGGGTAINAGFYTRASPSFIKEMGWDANVVNESYPWVEKQIVHKPKVTSWQQAFRDGLLEAGVSPFNGFTYDHKYGTKVGGTTFDRFGRRHTAAELLSTANPRNLEVLVFATVQRIVFDTSGKKPRAIGAIFRDENGNQHQAFLSRKKGSEVIVSSGAVGSPQLLLLSGIGPKAELERLKIPVVFDNENVGKEMADNPLNTIFVPLKHNVPPSLIQTVGITKVGVYIEASNGFGQSQDSIHCDHGITSAEIGQLSTIPPKQRTNEAIEAFRRSKKNLPHEVFKGAFILEKLARPLSRGHLMIKNTNVDDNPSVTFNYFNHPEDLKKCVEGIRIVEKIVKSKRVTNYAQCDKDTLDKLLNMSAQANVNLIPRHTNDSRSLEQFCKDTVVTIWHYHGGCRVGKVVTPDYRVLGVNRVRIVDGSILSESPGTNPQATLMMMGRYMGVKILRERLGE